MAGIYRRGKVYWARAQRHNRDERVSLQTTNRSVAQKRFREWIDELGATRWGDKPRRTFQETAERFVREHLTTLKPSSARRYGVSLKSLVVHFGNMTLDEIKSAALSEFEAARRLDGVRPGTIRRDLACLSSMLASASHWEWIEDGSNPVPSYLRRRGKRGLKEAPPRTRYLTLEEETQLLENATSAVREAITLAIDTGLRRDELFNLQWGQVDMERGIIATGTRTKSGRARHVPLPERSRHIVGTQSRHSQSGYVLLNPDTGKRYVAMEKGFKAAVRRSGLKDLRWHDLRRTAGCRWLQRDGRRMEEVSVLLGHSSVQVTEQRYAFLNGQEVAEILSGRTFPGTAATRTLQKNAAANGFLSEASRSLTPSI
jgi:integrase